MVRVRTVAFAENRNSRETVRFPMITLSGILYQMCTDWLVTTLTQYGKLVVVGAPVIVEKTIKVNDFARLSVRCPKRMTVLHSDLNADLGCWRKIPTRADPLVSVRIGAMRDPQAPCWCPYVVVFPL